MSARSRLGARSVRPAPGRPRDAGIGLAESIVAMGITVLVTTMVSLLAVMALRTIGHTTTRVDNAGQAELGSAAVSKVLRTAVLPQQLEDRACDGCTATAVIQADGLGVTFYANLGRTRLGPSRVTLRVVEDPDHPGTARLEQHQQEPIPVGEDRYTFCSPTSTGCVVQRRVLARSLLWPATSVFVYYDTEGQVMAAPLDADELTRISSVDVTVAVQTRPGQSRWPSLTVVQRVRLPNVEINLGIDDGAVT